jgi:ring-1,2-phenylacetyl-CoA epoxidase subunit PaaE
MKFYTVYIKNIIQETDDVKTYQISIPAHLKELFQYKSGQYITIEISIDNKKYRRAYSISSIPEDKMLSFTVKRLENGIISNFIHNNWQVDAEINIHPPLGNFFINTNALNEKTYIFVVAGSGITPIFSMIKNILINEIYSQIHVLYGSRNNHQIIFKSTLDKLCETNAEKLNIQYIISAPNIDYTGITGRISTLKLENWIDEKININENIYVYTCGPETLMEDVFETFRNRGLSINRIQKEHYHSNINANEINDDENSTITVTIDKITYNLKANRKTSILDIILNNEIDAPYSCMSGSCGSCKAKLLQGNIHKTDENMLSENEKKMGYILACQSICESENIELNFDI